MATFKTETRTEEPDAPPADTASRDAVDTEQITRAAGFRRLLETTSIVQWEADARTWAFTYVGPQAVRLLGYPIERWYEPDFWLAHVHPDASIAKLRILKVILNRLRRPNCRIVRCIF